VLKRAESAGVRWNAADDDHGERLFTAVREAIDAGVDPELALRRAADRFRDKVEEES
jgi:hypothetical protein